MSKTTNNKQYDAFMSVIHTYTGIYESLGSKWKENHLKIPLKRKGSGLPYL